LPFLGKFFGAPHKLPGSLCGFDHGISPHLGQVRVSLADQGL